MLLSIAINTWNGSDAYRFRIELETFVWSCKSKDCYLRLARETLDKWEPHKFKISSETLVPANTRACKRSSANAQLMHEKTSKRRKSSSALDEQLRQERKSKDKLIEVFILSGFEPSAFENDEIELILLHDAETPNTQILKIFNDFCSQHQIKSKIVSGLKLNAAAYRNIAMQVFTGDYLMFRDDDDYSAPFSILLSRCKHLESIGFGTNDSYEIKSTYDNIHQRFEEFHRHQKKPTIAIMLDAIKLKNTWGSIDNPFSKTPTPIEAYKIELVDRSPMTSMCTKIFSRESIRFINNSVSLASLEDARSHYLQQLTQHCCWFIDENKMSLLQDKKWLKMNVLGDVMRESDLNLDDFISVHEPSFVYVCPTGSYSYTSWSYCSVLGLLEAFRNAGKRIQFTINDIKRLKEIITTSIETKLVRVDSQTRVRALNSQFNELASLLQSINNYKFIYWFAVVHKKSDWTMFKNKLNRIRKLINMKNELKTINGADLVKENPVHPNTCVYINIKSDIEEEKRLVSISNLEVKDSYISINDDVDYVSIPSIQEMKGGSYVSERSEFSAIKLFLIAVLTLALIITIIEFSKIENSKVSNSFNSNSNGV